MQEEVGAALMDFAAAAELAEEEDRRQEAGIGAARALQEVQIGSGGQPSGKGGPPPMPAGMWLADLLKSLPASSAASRDTASTVSDPGKLLRSSVNFCMGSGCCPRPALPSYTTYPMSSLHIDD